MAAARRISLADQAARALLDRVRAGEWPLGAKLPGETTLAPQLGVGRSTMREAIRQLTGKGVLSTRQGAGVFVTALDAADGFSERVSRSEIATILEARLAVEVEGARLAALRRTEEDIDAASAALSRRRAAADGDYVASDTAFHRSIVAASHNPILVDLFDSFAVRSTEVLTAMVRARSQHRNEHDHALHKNLLDAVKTGDTATAERLSRDHLEAMLEQLADADPLAPPSPVSL